MSFAIRKLATRAGIPASTLWASDKKKACEKITQHTARPVTFHANVLERDESELPKVDVYSFASPCTSFSNAGLRDGVNSPNGALFFKPLEVISAVPPALVISENVLQIASCHVECMNLLISALEGMGYEAQWAVLNTANFGVPHNRKRWYLIAIHRSKLRRSAPRDWFPATAPLPEGSLLEDFIEILSPQKWQPLPTSKPLWTLNVQTAYERVLMDNVNPFTTPVVVDMGATPHYSYHTVAM